MKNYKSNFIKYKKDKIMVVYIDYHNFTCYVTWVSGVMVICLNKSLGDYDKQRILHKAIKRKIRL